MPALRLACLAYLSVALPGSTLGLLWPSMRLGFGAIDSTLNAHAASHFGARDINWMHASYGLGATIGPLLVTALLSDGLTWRWVYGLIAVVQVVLACVFILARRSWGTGPPAPALSGLAPVGSYPGARRRRGAGNRHRQPCSAPRSSRCSPSPRRNGSGPPR